DHGDHAAVPALPGQDGRRTVVRSAASREHRLFAQRPGDDRLRRRRDAPDGDAPGAGAGAPGPAGIGPAEGGGEVTMPVPTDQIAEELAELSTEVKELARGVADLRVEFTR